MVIEGKPQSADDIRIDPEHNHQWKLVIKDDSKQVLFYSILTGEKRVHPEEKELFPHLEDWKPVKFDNGYTWSKSDIVNVEYSLNNNREGEDYYSIDLNNRWLPQLLSLEYPLKERKKMLEDFKKIRNWWLHE